MSISPPPHKVSDTTYESSVKKDAVAISLPHVCLPMFARLGRGLPDNCSHPLNYLTNYFPPPIWLNVEQFVNIFDLCWQYILLIWNICWDGSSHPSVCDINVCQWPNNCCFGILFCNDFETYFCKKKWEKLEEKDSDFHVLWFAKNLSLCSGVML